VSVTRPISGTFAAGSSTVVEQIDGTIPGPDGSPVSVILEGDEPLQSGATYMFFADYKPDGNLTSPPFGRLEVGAGGDLQPLAEWTRLGALRQLSELSVDGAAAAVKDAE
jgi:hypothetical protein